MKENKRNDDEDDAVEKRISLFFCSAHVIK